MSCGNTAGDEAVIPSLGQLFHSQLAILGTGPYRPSEFAELWDLFCSSDLRGIVDSEFSLSDAGSAHEKMQSGDFFGKILLRP